MKKNSLFLLAGAIVLAVGVALLARILLTPPPPPPPVVSLPEEQPARVEPVAPLVSHRNAVLTVVSGLRPGDFIDGSSLEWNEVDAEPSRSLFFIKGVDTIDALYGATVRQPVQSGQALSVGLVVRQSDPGFLAAILRPGMRAVSVPTNLVESNFGLVSSGDHVDVILALKRGDAAAGKTQTPNAPHLAAQTILHAVRVLALNNRVRGEMQVRPDDGAKKAGDDRGGGEVGANVQTVTLEVSSADAEKLALAKEIGSLQLALIPAREVDQPGTAAARGVTTLRATTDLYDTVAPTWSGSVSVQAFRGKAIETLTVNAR